MVREDGNGRRWLSISMVEKKSMDFVKLKFLFLKPKLVYLRPFLYFLPFPEFWKRNFMYFEHENIETQNQ